jgi:hypothetical protein
MRNGHRNEAKAGHERRQDWPQTGLSTLFDSYFNRESLLSQFTDVCQQHDAVQNSDSKERDETKSCGDAERHSAQKKSYDTTGRSQSDIQEDQQSGNRANISLCRKNLL